MQGVADRLSGVRVKDIALIALCLITMYLLRARESVLLTPEWRIDSEVLPPTKGDTHREILPQPIVTDLESDGVNEVVMVTSDLHVQISVMPWQFAGSVLPHMEIRHKVELPRTLNEEGRRGFPVSMATGYLHANASLDQLAKQVIVVVTDNWNVHCYDHTLVLLWSVTLLDLGQTRQQYYVKSMSAVVTPHSLARHAHGMVIVGGSFGHKLHAQKADKFRSDSTWQSFSALPDDTMRQAEDTALHFSTFALAGNNGSILWHHLPTDFQQSEDETLWKAHHWKLGLNRRQHHQGELHWAKYLPHLLRFLPHRWDGIYDTKFEIARVKRAQTGHKTKRDTSTLDDLIGLEDGPITGAQSHTFVKNPNVIVIHHHKGIEVLNLVTGQPVTQLPMSAEKSSYTDIDDDGTVEEVKVVWHEKGRTCEGQVSSTHPVSKMLFTQSICHPATWSSSLIGSVFSSPDGAEDLRLAVAPQVVKSVTKRSGIFNHLSGKSLPSNKKGSDSLFMTSSGRLSSYGPYGEPNWQVRVASTWSDISHVSGDSLYEHSEMGRIYRHLFKPSMLPMATKVNCKKTSLLVVGWNHMTLVDLRDGHVLGEHTLPCQPVSPPVFGDYNNDGYADVIISCNIGYLGFGVEHHYNYLYTVLMGVAALLGVWLTIWCCTPEHLDDFQDDLSD